MRLESGKIGWWSHGKRIWWPQEVEQIRDPKTRLPVKPFTLRENIEPWLQAVTGLSAWYEAKREPARLAGNSVSMFQPHMVNSFGRRLPPRRGDQLSVWNQRAGPVLERLEQLVLRNFDPRTGGRLPFDAKAERARKVHFAAMLNSHCRSKQGKTYTEGTVLR